jgi:hypothetical protein
MAKINKSINGIIERATTKKLVAILNQALSSQTSGVLVIGKTYLISAVLSTDSFANVGHVTDGVPFIATGTTPTTWTNSTIVIDVEASKPIATELENDTQISFTWDITAKGTYKLTSSQPIFDAGKTQVVFGLNANGYTYKGVISSSTVLTFTQNSGATATDGMVNVPVEITVYP